MNGEKTMKKRFLLLFAVIALFALFAMSAGADTVINQHGDAESPDALSLYTSNASLTIVTDPYNASNKCFQIKPGSTSKTWSYFRYPMNFEAGASYILEYDVALGKDTNGNDYSARLSYNARYGENGNGLSDHSAGAGNVIGTSDKWVHQKVTVVISDKYTETSGSYFGVFVPPMESGSTFANRGYYIDNFTVTKVPTMNFSLSYVFSDNMMLQNGKDAAIFGKTTSAKPITVKLYDKNKNIVREAVAVIENGAFRAEIPAVTDTSGNAYTIEISQDGVTKTINNVIFGEVWLFSGQSNMELTVNSCTARDHSDYKDMLPDKEYPDVRMFISGDNGVGEWKVVNTENAKTFSAVGYNTVMALHKELGVPVGGISTAQGGTSMAQNTAPCSTIPNGGEVYNKRTKPVAGYTIKGFMWYQGENDRGNSNFVRDFEIFLNSWRAVWNDTDNSLPFYYVQLPQSPAKIWHISGGNFMTSPVKYNATRLFQNEFLLKHEDENIAMAVTIDTVEKIDRIYTNVDTAGQDPLHPWNKKPVGERLALLALEKTYGRTDVESDSPRIEEMSVSGNTVTLKYKNVAGGLKTEDGEMPRFFELAGADGVYYEAVATITGKDTITLTSDKVANPMKAAYFYEDHYVNYDEFFKGNDINLFGGTGLPAMPEVVTLPLQITFDLDGGEGNVENKNAEAGKPVTLPSKSEVTKDGYILRGWFDGTKVTREASDYTVSNNQTGNVLLKAVWVKNDAPVVGLSYEFNTSDGFIGWSAHTATCTVEDGSLNIQSIGYQSTPAKTDPRLTSPMFSLDASTYTKLVIRMKNNSPDKSGAFRFKRVGDPSGVGDCHALGNVLYISSSANDADYKEYVYDLSSLKNWYGTVERFWLDAVHTASGLAQVDYIRFVKDGYTGNEPSSMHKYSVRVKDPAGIRFASFVTEVQRSTALEYGYIASTEEILGESELTFDCGKKFAGGVAYTSDEKTDVVFAKEGENTIFTAVLKNIPESKYKIKLVVRPYIKVKNAQGGTDVLYGGEMRVTLYEIANRVLSDASANLSEEEKAFLEGIIE